MVVNANQDERVYRQLTEQEPRPKDKWTLYLLMACLSASMASFIFGYNIGSTNLPTPLIKDFFTQRYYPEFSTLLKQASNNSANVTTNTNGTISAEYKEMKLEVDAWNTLLWTVTNVLFVIGGMIGAFGSKYVQDKLGRKNGILFHHLFSIIGSILVIISPYVNSPECIIISRFFFGIQGGMSCSLIPTYNNEISPAALRGAVGVIHQLGITVGILVSQTLGFRQILGTPGLWNILLGIPIIPGVLGFIMMWLLCPETPRALLLHNRDADQARIVLKKLRNSKNIGHEIDEMNQELSENTSNEAVSISELFRIRELRWPLFTGLVLQLTQQLCGINAIFFYSEGIFRKAGIKGPMIQYAIFSTGFVNVIMTLVCIPLIDRLGRKPLLVYPMIIVIIDFIALTAFLLLQSQEAIFSYLSILCIIIFIMCFAIGLGPIPFVYVAEVFRQESRASAMAICMFTNWLANLILTLTFPYLAVILENYVFLVFMVIVAFAVIVIIKKVPETKNKRIEEIYGFFNGRPVNVSGGPVSEKLLTTRA